jgi:hypothetical protein
MEYGFMWMLHMLEVLVFVQNIVVTLMVLKKLTLST